MSIRIVGFVPCMLAGYVISVAIETPVLLLGLRPKYSFGQKLWAGVLLTACSYPFVCFVFPFIFPRDSALSILYIPVAETFAPLFEGFLFWLWFTKRESLKRKATWRDILTIIAANLASFGIGEFLKYTGVIDFVC
jgi:hypothetical protein